MSDGADRIATLVGAVIAFLLQVLVAPHIALFAAVPNFMLAYVVVVALVRADSCGVVMPFVLGMLYNLTGSGPVGAMAFLFMLATLLASRAFAVLDNDTLFMPLLMLVVVAFLAEVVYGGIMLACGVSAGPLEAFVYRSLPCALYDCVAGLVMYPLAQRFLAPRTAQAPGTPLIS